MLLLLVCIISFKRKERYISNQTSVVAYGPIMYQQSARNHSLPMGNDCGRRRLL